MDIVTTILWLLILSMCVASIAWTVTQEEIFREFREAFQHRSENSRFSLVRKFCYVWTCEYCFSHWVTILVLGLTGFHLLINDWRGYILAFFVLPWLANQWMSLYRHLRVEIKHKNVMAEEVKQDLEE